MNLFTFLLRLQHRNLLLKREKCNRQHLEFNKKIASAVEEICDPISSLGVAMFTYSRIFNGGERIYISSNGKWVEHYITHEFQDEVNHLPHYIPNDSIKYTFWSEFKDDRVFSAVNKYGMTNGVSIYEKQEEYVDFFDFAFEKDNTQHINFYLNNTYLFKKFIEYFKEKIFLILNFEDKENVLVPKRFISFDQIPREKSSDPPNLSGVFSNLLEKKFENSYKEHTLILSNKELECLDLFSKGYSIKTISRLLSLSPSSVRSYLNISKMKFDFRTTKEIVNFYKEQIDNKKN